MVEHLIRICACVIWLLLLGLQNIGFWEFLRRKTNTDMVFLPGIAAVIQISLLFLAGILNLLPQTTALIWAFGLGFFFYAWWKDRNLSFLRNFLSFPCLYLLLFSILFLLFLPGKELLHIDNFSHWGLIAKTILQKNRFPNFLEEGYILFQEYPLGSAIYLYYCMHFSGAITSEWRMMFCQGYLYLAFLLPIFRKNGKNSLLVFVLMVLFTNFSLVFFDSITDLLVDRLLVLAGMCMLCYVAEYCGAGKLSVSSFLITASFLVANLQIKNSSIFFVAIACLLILWEGRGDKQWAKRLCLIGIPVFAFVLWNRHCKLVYTAPDLTLHAMNFANYAAGISEKSPGQILAITKELVYFVLINKGTWIIAITALLAGVFVFQVRRAEFPSYCKQVLFAACCLLVYILGLLGMYIFSMPSVEADYLAEIARYYGSAVFAALYWFCYWYSAILDKLSVARGHKMEIALTLCILAFFPILQIAFGCKGVFLANVSEYDYVDRGPFDRALAVMGEDSNQEDYAVIYQDRDLTDYYFRLMRYLRPNSNVQFVSSDMPIQDQGVDAQYVIVLDWDTDYVQQWVQECEYVRLGDSLMRRAAQP